ncbi:MAG: pyruvate kinase [Candidatus Parcubacteria bacterium]|jgi:pyruvate kinase
MLIYFMGTHRSAKIIGKIADNNSAVEYMKSLFDNGVDVAWLNTAHQGEEEALGVVERIRSISTDIPILIDTKGPEIRTKNIEEPIPVIKDEEFIITGDLSVTGGKVVYAAYENLAAEVPVGTQILVDDGKFGCVVKSIDGTKLVCVAEMDGTIKNKKSINIPGVHIELPALSDKDRGFVHFCAKHEIDYIIHSFVRNKKDIDEIKEILAEYPGNKVKIIAKIENREGFDNIDEILENCEGLMVARGDLGVEVPFEEVPYMQKHMVRRAIEMGKYSIVATQALHSMVENPRPTRAEVSDVANAVLDGTDGVSMSDETAFGKYPLDATRTMARIMKFTEANRDEMMYTDATPMSTHPLHVVAESVVFTADMSHAAAIVLPAMDASLAQVIAAYRPKTPVFALSADGDVVRSLKLAYAVHAKRVEGTTHAALLKNGLEALKAHGLTDADRIVVVTPEGDDKESFDVNVVTVAQALAK